MPLYHTDDQAMLRDTARGFMADEGSIAKQLRHLAWGFQVPLRVRRQPAAAVSEGHVHGGAAHPAGADGRHRRAHELDHVMNGVAGLDVAARRGHQHLDGREWFVGDSATLADVCLFAYTHVAGEAEFDLPLYPHVTDWIERVKSLPLYQPMQA